MTAGRGAVDRTVLLRVIALILLLGVLQPCGARARSPVPFFQQVRQVGLLCRLDAADERTGSAAVEPGLSVPVLCGRAANALSALLDADRWPVDTLAANDARIADPATLPVLLHATIRLEGGDRLLAVAAGLQRAQAVDRPGPGAPPFFVARPQALRLTPAAANLHDALDAALHRLLEPVAQALQANR